MQANRMFPGEPPPSTEEPHIQERIFIMRMILLLLVAICLGCLGSLTLNGSFPF